MLLWGAQVPRLDELSFSINFVNFFIRIIAS